MGTSSELITLGELVEKINGENKNIVIPLLQRNYKWGVRNNESEAINNKGEAINNKGEAINNESEATAEKLFEDIVTAMNSEKNEYTIGMATFYKNDNVENDNVENDNVIQIIDGQQRLITLSLLMKALGKYNDFIQLQFERDENKERENFLKNNTILDTTSDSVDVKHMDSAYRMFCNKLSNCQDVDKLFDWLLNNLKIICRYTENEPLHEFLNLNEKKTEFSSTDYDRAYQLKYQADSQKITPAMIIKKHNEIQKYLYSNNDIFELVKERYPKQVNRMDLIFENIKKNVKTLSDYYEKIDLSEDRDKKYKECYEYLDYCHKVLRSIHQEIEKRDDSSLNVNIYNAVMMLYKIDKNFKFFDLLNIDENKTTFEQKVKEKFNLLAETYGKNPSKNAFMHSQLLDEISKDTNKFAISESAYEEAEEYITETELEIFEEKVTEVEALIEKGKNYSELVKGGKKSFLEILDTSEFNQIIVPMIQRDYTFGCNKEKVEELLFDISKTVLMNSRKGIDDSSFKEEPAARVVFESIKKSKLWIKPVDYKKELKEKSEFFQYSKLFELSGFDKWEKGDFRTTKKKEELNTILKKLTDKLSLTDEDYKSIKENKYFKKVVKEDEEEKFLFSVLFGNLDNGDFYLYDGQQRIVTLVYLCAFLINKEYNNASEERKDKLNEYIKLLKKFKFEDRKNANDLLNRLLYVEKPISSSDEPISILNELESYIIDHTTYSIVTLLNTYDGYKNEYEKEIMCFDLDYIMNNVVFEFSVVKEASIADQMYMDLNSKNVPLTIYENYKAELVYILSTRFNDLFEHWKYQLDNSFLNICYKYTDKGTDNVQWEKCKSEEAEEMEIKIIHWCFKMVCMEYGFSVGDISDAKKRLHFMEKSFAEKAISIVGDILNNKIFNDNSKDTTEINYFEKAKNIVDYSNKTNEFNFDEFSLWFELRYCERENEYKFVKTNNYVKIYNWEKTNALDSAKYWVKLCKHYEKNVDENNGEETYMIKFLLQKFNSFWEEGFLQSELFENIEGLYNEANVVNTEEISQVTNFYSNTYLTKKPDEVSWFEYIYTIKLNEMLDVKKYELVKVWEKAELENNEIFSTEEKRLAYKNAFGDYNLWSKVKGEFPKTKGNLTMYMNDDINIRYTVISEMKDSWLWYSRIRKEILGEDTHLDIEINCSENSEIKESIKNYVLANPNKFINSIEFINSIKNKYYVWVDMNIYKYEKDEWKLIGTYKSDTGNWESEEKIKIGVIEIPVSELTSNSNFFKELKKVTDNIENKTLFTWWAYNLDTYDKKNLDAIYTKILNPDIYNTAKSILKKEDMEKFKKVYETLKGALPNN